MIIDQYQSYRDKLGNREQIYRVIQANFGVKRALYPGSHIDIGPSLYIEHVTYVDTYKGAMRFFRDLDKVKTYIDDHKTYEGASTVVFYGVDYYQLDLKETYDLVISQFAGFVGQATKKYLRSGGILLVNDSHGDASLAYLDPEFDLVGVIDDQAIIRTDHLDRYFKFARPRVIDASWIREQMKGPKYKHMASNYIFKRL